MYKAVRFLRMDEKHTKRSLKIKNKEGNFVLSDESKANTIAEWYKHEMSGPDGPLKSFNKVKPFLDSSLFHKSLGKVVFSPKHIIFSLKLNHLQKKISPKEISISN